MNSAANFLHNIYVCFENRLTTDCMYSHAHFNNRLIPGFEINQFMTQLGNDPSKVLNPTKPTVTMMIFVCSKARL